MNNGKISGDATNYYCKKYILLLYQFASSWLETHHSNIIIPVIPGAAVI